MRHITLHFRCTFYPAADSTELHTRVHEVLGVAPDEVTQDHHFHQAELLWERGQGASVRIAMLRALREWMRATGLDLEDGGRYNQQVSLGETHRSPTPG